MKVNAETLTTEEFWEKMCDPRAYRVSPHLIAIEHVLYVTLNPPEKEEGFVKDRADDVAGLLDRAIPVLELEEVKEESHE